MSKDLRLSLGRKSLYVVVAASMFLFSPPAFSQGQTTSSDGVTVEKNSDGTVEAYDTETVEGGGGQEGETVIQGGDGRIHYRPGTSPYTKKFNDGTTVRRNSDGSIETWDEGETHHYSGGGGEQPVHRKRQTSKKAKASVKTTHKVQKKSK